MNHQLGRLTDIDPRSAWTHESVGFTPWLSENLDRLADVIGIPLELTGREVGVGRYSADILAMNPSDGSIVLIENQLEWSDHTHMGQIMTYLAGLEAQVIVWLAPAFREEHLSALRWLNQHTDPRFAFFAVRLRVVQIGDSPLAPLFEVLEKPNSWDKSLQKTAKAAMDFSDATAQRIAFWERYALSDNAVTNERKTGPGGSNRWKPVPGTSLVINRYKAKRAVGLFVRGVGEVDDDGLIAMMEPHLGLIEDELGAPPGDWSNFWSELELTSDDPASWQPAIEWLQAQTDRYVTIMHRVFA